MTSTAPCMHPHYEIWHTRPVQHLPVTPDPANYQLVVDLKFSLSLYSHAQTIQAQAIVDETDQ